MKHTISAIAAFLVAGSALAIAPMAQAQQNSQQNPDQTLRGAQRHSQSPDLHRPGSRPNPPSSSGTIPGLKSRGPVFYTPPPWHSPFGTGTLPQTPGIMPAYVHPPSYYGPAPSYSAPPSYFSYYSGPPVQYFMYYGQLYAQDLTTGFIYPVP